MAAAEKAQRYEAFVSDVLQRDLRWVTSYRDTNPALATPGPSPPQRFGHAPELRAGPDPQRVFVALGFGFFAELTLPEALRHLERRSSLLQRLSDSLTRDGAKIRAHIRLVLEVTPPPFLATPPPAGHAPLAPPPLLCPSPPRACGSCRGCRSPP
ncbi:UXT protein, partial [Drymodes brunneopygia]|nr:UXT protein [Drymodes brunneopygia]